MKNLLMTIVVSTIVSVMVYLIAEEMKRMEKGTEAERAQKAFWNLIEKGEIEVSEE